MTTSEYINKYIEYIDREDWYNFLAPIVQYPRLNTYEIAEIINMLNIAEIDLTYLDQARNTLLLEQFTEELNSSTLPKRLDKLLFAENYMRINFMGFPGDYVENFIIKSLKDGSIPGYKIDKIARKGWIVDYDS